MDFETLIYTQDGYTGILTINRPQALNALNAEVLKELKIFTDYIKTNTDIRVLIITGAGDKAFVAGADIKAMQKMTPEEAEEFSVTAQTLFNAIEALPFAVIAAVNGFALGGAVNLHWPAILFWQVKNPDLVCRKLHWDFYPALVERSVCPEQ